MKGYEYKSVIEARKKVEKEFKFFREMMKEIKQNPNRNSHIENNSTIKGYEFKSVIEAREKVEKEFRFFREMMEIKKNAQIQSSHSNP